MFRPVIVLTFLLAVGVDFSVGNIHDKYVTRRELAEKFEANLENIRESNEMTIATVEKMLSTRTVSGQACTGEGVAFSTTLTANLLHIGIGQVIKYDNVQLNEGNGYNSLTGVFAAPYNGVYLFSYFLGHGDKGQMWLELMHNGNKVNAGVTDGFEQYEDDQGGNVAVIRLAAGDTVWVESWHQRDATIQGTNGFTTFSGVRIYLDNDGKKYPELLK